MAWFLKLAGGELDFALDLNLWASPHRPELERGDFDGVGFCAARARASFQRLQGGALAWNNWSVKMLERKPKGESRVAATWQALAVSDFRGLRSRDIFNAAGAIFPSDVLLDDAVLSKYAWFQGSRFCMAVSAARAQFGGDALFENSTFDGPVSFAGARFGRSAEFRNIHAEAGFDISGCAFAGDLWARGSTFKGGLVARGARFSRDVSFSASSFLGEVDFSDADFADNASFEASLFSGSTSFERARFGRSAWFSNSQFRTDAKFDRARFQGRAAFDDIGIADQQSRVADQIAEIRRALAQKSG